MIYCTSRREALYQFPRLCYSRFPVKLGYFGSVRTAYKKMWRTWRPEYVCAAMETVQLVQKWKKNYPEGHPEALFPHFVGCSHWLCAHSRPTDICKNVCKNFWWHTCQKLATRQIDYVQIKVVRAVGFTMQDIKFSCKIQNIFCVLPN